MNKREFQEKLWTQLSEWQDEIKELRPLAEKKKEEEGTFDAAAGITAHQIAEALGNSLEEAKNEVDSLNDIAPEAWEMRGEEIRSKVEETFTDLRERFKALAESLKER